MEHLKSFSKIVYIDTPLETIIERIDEGQERGLAVPGNPSIEEVYFDRKPLYEEFSQHTIDGSKSIDELIEIVLNILMSKKILLAGASGLVGNNILQVLNNNESELILLSRKSFKIIKISKN